MIPKVLFVLDCTVSGEVPGVGKAKIKFGYRFINYRNNYGTFREDNQKIYHELSHTHYCRSSPSGIEAWDFALFEQCKNC